MSPAPTGDGRPSSGRPSRSGRGAPGARGGPRGASSGDRGRDANRDGRRDSGRDGGRDGGRDSSRDGRRDSSRDGSRDGSRANGGVPARVARQRGTGGSDRPENPLGLAARRAAWQVLRGVAEHDAYANLLLPSVLREAHLADNDAALATNLTYGTLRHRGTLDAILATCVDRRPWADVDPRLADVLRLGAYQLLILEQPPHAAVSVSVELGTGVGGIAAGGFVNAVLRKVSQRTLDEWVAQVAPDRAVDEVGHLAIAHSHPAWVVAALRDALGGPAAHDPETMADLERLLVADNTPPPVTLAARPGGLSVAELTEQVGAGATPGRWSPVAVRLSGGDPGAVAAVRSGLARVQDEGSQLVALALARTPTVGPDTGWWLDSCAGPGGKAALLAGVAAGVGARVLASDLAPHRAQLVTRALAGGRTEAAAGSVVVADATAPAWPDAAFDRVLVDAPCTGLGAIRRRPEARWRRVPGDVSGLRRLQVSLLGQALRAVRPGGVVAYATCSPHLAETRTVVADALRAAAKDGIEIERLTTRDHLPAGLDLPLGRTDAQLWPHRHDTDAMYLALLRRTS
jgi:16S rRNA (cytosine967-C5)-methyltransferase